MHPAPTIYARPLAALAPAEFGQLELGEYDTADGTFTATEVVNGRNMVNRLVQAGEIILARRVDTEAHWSIV